MGELPTLWEVDDELWGLLAPLLVIEKPRLKSGRPRADDRRIFNGLIWLARTGSQWGALPVCFGPKSTAHERFQEWVAYGKFAAAWALLLREYDGEVGLQLEWQAAHGCLVKAPGQKRGLEGEAQATGRNPTDRGKCGTKRHLLTDGAGVPLAVVISGANRHDMKKLGELLDASLLEQELVEQELVEQELVEQELVEQRSLQQPQDTPSAQPEKHLCLDRGYDYKACREQTQEHGYTPHIPPKATPQQPLPAPGDPERHPPRRWVVEVSHAWFNRFRRLLIRWDKIASNYLGFVQLAASLIIYRKLRHARALSG